MSTINLFMYSGMRKLVKATAANIITLVIMDFLEVIEWFQHCESC